MSKVRHNLETLMCTYHMKYFTICSTEIGLCNFIDNFCLKKKIQGESFYKDLFGREGGRGRKW